MSLYLFRVFVCWFKVKTLLCRLLGASLCSISMRWLLRCLDGVSKKGRLFLVLVMIFAKATGEEAHIFWFCLRQANRCIDRFFLSIDCRKLWTRLLKSWSQFTKLQERRRLMLLVILWEVCWWNVSWVSIVMYVHPFLCIQFFFSNGISTSQSDLSTLIRYLRSMYRIGLLLLLHFEVRLQTL